VVSPYAPYVGNCKIHFKAGSKFRMGTGGISAWMDKAPLGTDADSRGVECGCEWAV
jgi:hypothetical protein